jgi:hypothetical protein
MASQNLIFVLLPNGVTPEEKLRVSAYLTPRLEGGATLASFPDLLAWTQRVQENGLNFELRCVGKTQTVAAQQGLLRPDIWQTIFKPNTYVEPYTVPDYAQRLIATYPSRDAALFLKGTYQHVGSGTAGSEGNRGGLREVLSDLVFRDGSKSTLADEISRKRVELWREQRDALDGGVANTPGGPAPNADTHDVMTRFAMYHAMPPAPNRAALPSTEKDFAKTLDFHKALAALNSYPTLLRALGLVFDLELTADFCPPSPAAGVYRTIALRKVTPGTPWMTNTRFSYPETSFLRDDANFSTAPATPPSTLTTGQQFLPADVVAGFLALAPDNFHLLDVDLDGALLKALSLADNAENARDQTKVGDVLPALRSSGIGLYADARGMQLLQSISDNTGFDQAVNAKTALPRSLNARDLLRGFRLDVWSSATQEWRSLHFRNSVYRFGSASEIMLNEALEEGFLEPTATQPSADPTRKDDPVATGADIPQPGTDLYVHERIARWEGWSLSVKRPGLPLNRSVDPGQATTPDPTIGQPMTPFKMTATFSTVTGSLPQLRFGRGYRIRARAVDLAGNSLPLDVSTPEALALPAGNATLPCLRYEPVSPPLLVLQQTTAAGATLERMVVRSWNNAPALDAVPTAERDHRHVGPPRISENLAELHGMFDGSDGNLRGDADTFSDIVTRDGYEIPSQDGVPLEPSATLAVDYLPDPIARGAALRNLPQTPDNSNGRLSAGALIYNQLPDVQPRAGSVTYVDFGTEWPQREAFLLSVEDGSAAPGWSEATRNLVVSLPKGSVFTVDLSSYISETDLMLMGVWNWLREDFEARELAALQGGIAAYTLGSTSDLVALLTRLVLEGGHDLITPSRTLTLVHAVQQPLGSPQFVQLPVVHRPTAPIFASALRNSFTPITAWRSYGSHVAVLLGGLEVNGATSSKIDLEARWQEAIDDPAEPAPTKAWHSAHVETLPLATTDAGVIFSDGTQTRMVGTYVPQVDALWFSAPIDELEGVTTPSEVAAPLHRLDDTKHRWVGYTAIANSRFQEYFPAGLDFTRSSEPLLVDVPSSARPLVPDLVYVVPTFGWEQQETTNVKSSIRFGNGLRIYLNRGWYSSGDGELLGVVLWNGAAPDYPTRELYKPFFTQWGNDPVWKTGFLEDVPSIYDFPEAVTTATALTLEESARPFDVAGHTVSFDSERKLWFCDVQLQNSSSYMPFIRLALARYQPHSISGIELSRVVLADYAQLTPDRSAVISMDPADTRRAQVFIGGVAPQPPAQSAIEVTVQRRLPNMISDVAWEQAPPSVVTVTENSPDAKEPDAVLWSGSVVFAEAPPPDQFRIVVREFERILIDTPGVESSGEQVPAWGERMVYVAIVSYVVPAAG